MSKGTWCIDPTSMDMLVQEHGNGLNTIVWQPTYTAASQGRISILRKPRVCTILTTICGPWVQGLLGTLTLLPWIFWFKSIKMS